MLNTFVLFVVVMIFLVIAFGFVHDYQERERQRRYMAMVKYHRKPLNISQERLDRISEFYADWERRKAELNKEA